MQAKVRRQKEGGGKEEERGGKRARILPRLAVRNSKHPRTLFVSLGPRESSPLTAWKLLSNSLANVDIKKKKNKLCIFVLEKEFVINARDNMIYKKI